MDCAVCGSGKSNIVRTASADYGDKFKYSIKTRKCLECGNVFKTVELPIECVPLANPEVYTAIRQLAQSAKSALRLAEATEALLMNERIQDG